MLNCAHEDQGSEIMSFHSWESKLQKYICHLYLYWFTPIKLWLAKNATNINELRSGSFPLGVTSTGQLTSLRASLPPKLNKLKTVLSPSFKTNFNNGLNCNLEN